MTTKEYSITFKLPDLSASHFWHNVTVNATSLEQALKFAYRELKKRPAVKGKRLKSGEIKFELIG
jgi:hypothetical protein